jgi:hypothetical protein
LKPIIPFLIKRLDIHRIGIRDFTIRSGGYRIGPSRSEGSIVQRYILREGGVLLGHTSSWSGDARRAVGIEDKGNLYCCDKSHAVVRHGYYVAQLVRLPTWVQCPSTTPSINIESRPFLEADAAYSDEVRPNDRSVLQKRSLRADATRQTELIKLRPPFTSLPPSYQLFQHDQVHPCPSRLSTQL